MKLGGFRDKHIQIVSRYVIVPASRPPPQRQNGSLTGVNTQARVNLASATSSMKVKTGSVSFQDESAKSEKDKDKVFYGTGGTDLIPFLKSTRDGTKAAARFID
jgi:indoleamine 2,3-dioxygenase